MSCCAALQVFEIEASQLPPELPLTTQTQLHVKVLSAQGPMSCEEKYRQRSRGGVQVLHCRCAKVGRSIDSQSFRWQFLVLAPHAARQQRKGFLMQSRIALRRNASLLIIA